MNYAAIDKTTKLVITNIEWNGESYLDPYLKDNYDLIPWDETTKGFPVSPGDSYDETSLGFIQPKPYPSWIFDKTIWYWVAPIPYPTNGAEYGWDENTQQWVIFENVGETSFQKLSKDNENLSNIING